MTKFKPDSEESRAWVRFMAAAMTDNKGAVGANAIIADAALEEYQRRLDLAPEAEDSVFVPDPVDDLPDCTPTEHQPYCRHFKLAEQERVILKSASKVDGVIYAGASPRKVKQREIADHLVTRGLLTQERPGRARWHVDEYVITPAGREALK